VKLFASHLLLACVILLSWDAPRLLRFLVGNKSVDGTALYEPPFSSLRARGFALAAKALFVWFMLITPFLSTRSRAKSLAATPAARPFRTGVYDVVRFAVNRDTLPPVVSDSIRWRDVIFDNAGAGSVNTTDSVFWQRYRRGYFRYRADTLAKTVVVWKTSTALDSTYLFTMRYDLPDTTRVRLWAPIRKDTIYVELVRTARHFQLAERQFHWISEYNR
jgi:hypothetical protein